MAAAPDAAGAPQPPAAAWAAEGDAPPGPPPPPAEQPAAEPPPAPPKAVPATPALVIDDLEKGVEKCEWDAVLGVLAKYDLSDDVLDAVLQKSAEKLALWSLDKVQLKSSRKAIRDRLECFLLAQKPGVAPPPPPGGDLGMLICSEPAEICVVPAEEPEPEKEPAAAQPVVAASEEPAPGKDPEAPPATAEEAGAGDAKAAEEKEKASASPPAGPSPSLGVQVASPEGDGAKSPEDEKGAKKKAKVQLQFDVPDDGTDVSRQKSHGLGKSKLGKSMGLTQSTYLAHGPSIGYTAKRAPEEMQVAKEISAKAKEMNKDQHLLVENVALSRLRQFKVALFVCVLTQMILFAVYVVFYMTPKTWDIIGFPILVARGSAYGACFWTAVLFLTMSRDLLSALSRFPPVRNTQRLMQLINCHKELHIFSAWEVLLDGCLHALMHHIGTFVALEKNDAKKLNTMLVCAQDKSTMPDGYIAKKGMGNFLEAFQHPECPLPENATVSYVSGVLSTPGITGYLLLITISSLGFFSRMQRRRANFRLFYLLHQMLVPTWVFLLIIHGANDWVGLGFPLVILVAGIPVLCYLWTRVRRVYLCCSYGARVVAAEKSVSGKLLRLEISVKRSTPCEVGEFAYINVPSIGYTEWHPYTISTSKEEDGEQVLTFCIMAVGVWTKKLHALFDKPSGGDAAWPTVYIDGPFYAPTVGMPERSTVVGIGAGVGVTPFLSFLGEIAGQSGATHKNAHVFWMSAFGTDFMLFRDLFSQLERRAAPMAARKSFVARHNCSTVFHLHATPRFGVWNGKGVGSVFELAARDVWDQWLERLAKKDADKVPTFSRYSQPIHAVVSKNILASGHPLAVAMGSPEFVAEFLSIGDADESEDVFVYFCGNDFLKNMVQSACVACNEHRMECGQQQRYYFYYERFG